MAGGEGGLADRQGALEVGTGGASLPALGLDRPDADQRGRELGVLGPEAALEDRDRAAVGDQGLVVLGFPANNYGGQEPGTNDEIKTFCTTNYSVSFPMFAKVSVMGDDQAPLFQFLTKAENPDKTGDIGWNFEKFLIGKDGKLLRRFDTGTTPDDPEVIAAIKKAIEG